MNCINLISNARNGSSYLYSVITLHHINDLKISEPFGERQFTESGILNQETFLKTQLDKISCSCRAILKNHTYQIDLLSEFNLWDGFDVNTFFNIVLYRKNIFESSLSLALSRATGLWSIYQSYPDGISIEEDAFRSAFEHQYSGLMWFLRNNKKIRFDRVVAYEDLTYSTQTDYNNLGIGHSSVQIESKTNRAPNKHAVVQNINSLKSICFDMCAELHDLSFIDFNLQDTIK